MQRTGEIQEVQQEIDTNLAKQKEQLLRFQDRNAAIENTLSRTRKKVDHFKKSFLTDKIAITLVILIILMISGIIATVFLPSKQT